MKKVENLLKNEVAVKARDLQLQLKNVSKSMQELRTGRYEKSTLKDLEYKPETTRSFIIEAARRDASGTVISEARVITGETFAKAAEGMLKQEGADVSYQACFAAGTLVHTDKGLIPIEQVRVGTSVLSQPELGGGQDHRRVTDRIATLDQIVFAVQIKPISSNALLAPLAPVEPLATLITTPGHPFWVESLTRGQRARAGQQADQPAQHWIAVEQLEVGQILQLAGGSRARVQAAGIVYKTQHADLGFVANDAAATGIVLALPTDPDTPIEPASAERLDALDSAEPLKMAEPLKRTVYNLTVDEFHTYYVADMGVWVHNTYGGPEAVRAVVDRGELVAVLKEACFGYETRVKMPCGDGSYTSSGDINLIRVGDQVLSRCEITGEVAYKRVLKVFEHDAQPVYWLSYTGGTMLDEKIGHPYPIDVTAEHPFWVQGKGWVPAAKLVAGDELFSTECELDEPYSHDWTRSPKGPALRLRGERMVFEKLEPRPYVSTVYNLEIEDFHTYFVGAEGIWVHNTNERKGVRSFVIIFS